MSLPLIMRRASVLAGSGIPRLALVRSAGHSAGYWNKDWMPALEPPKTEEARRAAAKKYGMIPEDYKPMPADGLGKGDYPDLPIVPAEQRNPYEAYDYPEYKRNYGEPIHENDDLYGEDRWNRGVRLQYSPWKQLAFFLGACSTVILIWKIPDWLGLRIFFIKQMAKQMPYANPDKVYYTFDKK